MPIDQENVLRWKHVVPDYERRFNVLPGVTSLAHVSGYSDSDPRSIARRAQYDLFYVDHRSLLLDVRMLARAGLLVLRRPSLSRGASANGSSNGAGPNGASAPGDGLTAYRVTHPQVKGVTQ